MTARGTAITGSRPLDRRASDDFDLAPSSLADARALQQRVDRKYLLATGRLEPLLHLLRRQHLLLLASGAAWARYESLYFDSADRRCYHAHRRGLMPRYKVRIRHHLDRQLTFLELKRKERGGRTVKFRLPLPFGQDTLGANERRFIGAHAALDPLSLAPAVTISFLRLTLLGRSANERVTIDRDLAVTAAGRLARVPPLVVAEVKQARRSHQTAAIGALRTLRAREMSVSKYCLGTLLAAPVRDNVFRPLLHAIERLSV